MTPVNPAIGYTTYASGPSATSTLTDMFSYTQAGQIAGKRVRVKKASGSTTATGDLDLAYTYNSEGKVTSVTYPYDSGSGTSPSYTYAYDSMMRLSTMTDSTQNGAQTVNGVQYNAASQLTAINYYLATETRSYNSLMQVSNITVTGNSSVTPLNITYNYTDLAKNKTASQSSTLNGTSAVASLAVDGNVDGNWADNSITHTNLDANAWWQVDLGSSASVSSIAVWNRTDCCGSRLSDYWVFVSDTPFSPSDTPATLQNRAGTYSSHQTSQPSPSAVISIPGAQGRYVRVQLSGTNYLSLAEVQVFGLAPGIGGNAGKITSVYDALSGESVVYQYDSLNRLISAAGSGWTQTQAYDGFGNLTGRTGTGSAQSTSMSTPADPATNRLTGYTYDANGNLNINSNMYDPENRVSFANAGGVQYSYDAQNKRFWQATCTGYGNCYPNNGWVLSTESIMMFGADGKQIGTYSVSQGYTGTLQFTAANARVYFGGRLVAQPGNLHVMQAAVQDRLGSVGKYYPYGEDRSGQPGDDTVRFATYTRDSATGNDYADQRYYASTFGRFMTPDPYRGR